MPTTSTEPTILSETDVDRISNQALTRAPAQEDVAMLPTITLDPDGVITVTAFPLPVIEVTAPGPTITVVDVRPRLIDATQESESDSIR